MNDNILVNILGWSILLYTVYEIYSGVAWEKTGMVRRDESPFSYWVSVVIKVVVSLAIINVEYLQARFGV